MVAVSFKQVCPSSFCSREQRHHMRHEVCVAAHLPRRLRHVQSLVPCTILTGVTCGLKLLLLVIPQDTVSVRPELMGVL